MAKRQCDPTSGSIGKQTYGIGRNGQFVRARVIPANPDSPEQQRAREILTSQSRAWDGISDAQRAAWSVAASGYNSKSRLGMSGALTGNQYFVQINATLLLMGEDQILDPPDYVAPPPNTTSGLTITNIVGTIAIHLSEPTDVDSGTQLWCSKPCKAGVQRVPELFFLGQEPAELASVSNITSMVTAKWGVLPVGTRIFVGTRTRADGFLGKMVTFTAVVPSSG
jgi:hypothetical protein